MHKVALITGSARRIGAMIARALHQQGLNIVIHYRNAEEDSKALCSDLNKQRPNSAIAFRGDLLKTQSIPQFITKVIEAWGRLDVVVNNASSFYVTPISEATELQWDDLIGSNFKAPFFIAQAAADELKKNRGCIINIADVNALKPMMHYSIYCAAKAGLISLTQSMALELAPEVCVNAIAPGSIIWPDGDNAFDEPVKEKIVAQIPLRRTGNPPDIANAVVFLINQPYITGQILAIDGGRSINSSI